MVSVNKNFFLKCIYSILLKKNMTLLNEYNILILIECIFGRLIDLYLVFYWKRISSIKILAIPIVRLLLGQANYKYKYILIICTEIKKTTLIAVFISKFKNKILFIMH